MEHYRLIRVHRTLKNHDANLIVFALFDTGLMDNDQN